MPFNNGNEKTLEEIGRDVAKSHSREVNKSNKSLTITPRFFSQLIPSLWSLSRASTIPYDQPKTTLTYVNPEQNTEHTAYSVKNKFGLASQGKNIQSPKTLIPKDADNRDEIPGEQIVNWISHVPSKAAAAAGTTLKADRPDQGMVYFIYDQTDSSRVIGTLYHDNNKWIVTGIDGEQEGSYVDTSYGQNFFKDKSIALVGVPKTDAASINAIVGYHDAAQYAYLVNEMNPSVSATAVSQQGTQRVQGAISNAAPLSSSSSSAPSSSQVTSSSASTGQSQQGTQGVQNAMPKANSSGNSSSPVSTASTVKRNATATISSQLQTGSSSPTSNQADGSTSSTVQRPQQQTQQVPSDAAGGEHDSQSSSSSSPQKPAKPQKPQNLRAGSYKLSNPQKNNSCALNSLAVGGYIQQNFTTLLSNQQQHQNAIQGIVTASERRFDQYVTAESQQDSKAVSGFSSAEKAQEYFNDSDWLSSTAGEGASVTLEPQRTDEPAVNVANLDNTNIKTRLQNGQLVQIIRGEHAFVFGKSITGQYWTFDAVQEGANFTVFANQAEAQEFLSKNCVPYTQSAQPTFEFNYFTVSGMKPLHTLTPTKSDLPKDKAPKIHATPDVKDRRVGAYVGIARIKDVKYDDSSKNFFLSYLQMKRGDSKYASALKWAETPGENATPDVKKTLDKIVARAQTKPALAAQKANDFSFMVTDTASKNIIQAKE